MRYLPAGLNHPFESPEYISQAISNMANTNWKAKGYKALKEYYLDYIWEIPMFEIIFLRGNPLVKARINRDHKEFPTLSDLSIIPDQNVSSFGRANIPGQGVFYCCPDPETPFREVTQWHIDDFGTMLSKNILFPKWSPFSQIITTSIWEVVEDLRLVSVLFHEHAIDSSETFRSFKDYRDSLGTDPVSVSRNIILDFFSGEFAKESVKEESDYYLSALFSDLVHDTSTNFGRPDGLVYTSVANKHKGENIVLFRRAFERKLKYRHAFLNVVFNVKNDTLEVIKTGSIKEVNTIDAKGNLTWKECNDNSPTGIETT